MGGACAGNYLALHGKDTPIKAAVLNQPSADQNKSLNSIRDSWGGFFDFAIGISIRQMIRQHLKKINEDPNIKELDLQRILLDKRLNLSQFTG